MKRLILILITVLFLPAGEVFSQSRVSFSDNDFAVQLNSIRKTAIEKTAVKPADGSFEIKPANAENGRQKGQNISLSAHVTLTGNAWVPQNGGFVTVRLRDWTTVRDNSGAITSRPALVEATASMWVYPNHSVFHTAYANINVPLYKDDKYIGSAVVSGSIPVSGWPSSNLVNLHGSGYLTGSIYSN